MHMSPTFGIALSILLNMGGVFSRGNRLSCASQCTCLWMLRIFCFYMHVCMCMCAVSGACMYPAMREC